MGCTDPPSRVGSLPLYADVRLHILMTHRNDAGTAFRTRARGRPRLPTGNGARVRSIATAARSTAITDGSGSAT